VARELCASHTLCGDGEGEVAIVTHPIITRLHFSPPLIAMSLIITPKHILKTVVLKRNLQRL
jgi:hypothetical protein